MSLKEDLKEIPTTTFKLVSGVECEVRYLVGYDYETLTKFVKGREQRENLNYMLANAIIRVGKTMLQELSDEERAFFIKGMFEKDKKHALTMIRQYSFGYQKEFNFILPYTDGNGENKEITKVVPIQDGMFPIVPMEKQWNDYSEIEKVLELELPMSKYKVKVPLLDGNVQEKFNVEMLDDSDVLSGLKFRGITYLRKGEKGNAWVELKFGILHAVDITFLKNAVEKAEGKVHTEVRFEHPDAENLPPSRFKEKLLIIDLVGVPDFFFPSTV